MRLHDCNWQMIEAYLAHDDRIVLPIGSTEQHGYLSLGTDAIFHDWWNAPRVWEVVQRHDPDSSHGSWMEKFPWTRIPGVTMPAGVKPLENGWAPDA